MSPHSVTDYDPWVAPCRNGEGRGAYVLQGWILAESPWNKSYNLGIYNCRPPSVHGHERAGDTGFPLVNGKAHPQGFELADWLWSNRDYFGIQLVIWNRRIISRANPIWRPYSGVSPHVDHVHWELNWWGYSNLTLKLIDQHLPPGANPPGDEEEDMKPYVIQVDSRHHYVVQMDSMWWIGGTATIGTFLKIAGQTSPHSVDGVTFERMKLALNSDAATPPA